MPLYQSTAVNDLGQTLRGQMEASSESALETLLRKQGQWLELEVRLDTLPYDAAGPGGEKMPLGLKLGKFQCYVRGEKNCTLEIDWLEVVRE